MASEANGAFAYDDRKRLRESIREIEMSASPKKGKHEGGDALDTFSFPTFVAPLLSTLQQCCAGEGTGAKLHDKIPPDLKTHNTPSAFQPPKGPACGVLQCTPEPVGSSAMQKADAGRDQSLTPALNIASNAAAGHVQTLHARAMPLSPFEWGDIPDVPSGDENAATPISVVPLALEEEQAAADIGSPSQKGTPAQPSADVLQPSADEAERAFSLMQDTSIPSQNASQTSSLAETKILRPSNRIRSRETSDGLRDSFKFSQTFTFLGLLGNTKTSTVYFAQASDAVYAIKEGKKLHIQMELCTGGSLDVLLKRSEICQDENLPEDLLWLILSDAAHGLHHVHAHGVLHMDIKPENMFLDSSGTFKLGDFGLAVKIGNQSGWEEGDGRYVAPELLKRSQPPSGSADIYSLGSAMLHCALGTLPMERTPQVVRQRLLESGYSVEFQHIVACMIAASPQDRPTADMICKMLQRTQSQDFQDMRVKLGEVAGAVHAQRVAQQRSLHCSPSFSLSQSIDNATPGSVGQPTAKPEKVWSQLFSVQGRGARPRNGKGRSLGSALPIDRAPIPPIPNRGRNALDHGPSVGLAGTGQLQPSRVGTPPSVLPKLHQHQKCHHRSPSAGSFDRCGALSYSSNGQASGSLNLELYPEIGGLPAQGDASTLRTQSGANVENRSLQQHRQGTIRQDPLQGRRRDWSLNHTRHARARSRRPLALLVPDARDPIQPSPRSDVLHRYFSSQVQHEESSLKPQILPPNASTAALSQVEVTWPNEANAEFRPQSAVRKTRQRRTAVPRPPDLHDLKDCLISSQHPAARQSATLRAASKTKGRVMVWKGLQDAAPGSGSSFQGVVSARHSTKITSDKQATTGPSKFGNFGARRSRGTKIAGMAAGVNARDQENDSSLLNASLKSAPGCGAGRPREGLHSLAKPSQPHQSKLRAVKTMHVSKAREMSTEVLASSRPELKQPLAVCQAHNRGL